jgi:hypothetical protein
MPSLAAYPSMMQRDRQREGFRVCRAAWLLGVTVREYRELERAIGCRHQHLGADGRSVQLAAAV